MAYSASAWADQDVHRVGVLDIGSNSIRLVVFTGDRRMPFPVFNEKALCGLGAGLRETGRLSEAGRASAVDAIGRFLEIAGEMRLVRLDVIATAAVRDADNGPAFARELDRRFGIEVRVLSGTEEARLSALGVISAFPGADGVVGDLGGGSLELVDVVSGRPGSLATLPLGALHLGEVTAASSRALQDRIDRHVEALPWLDRLAGRTLYAVGGGWRSLARLHMVRTGYPLEIIHGYGLASGRASAFLEQVVTEPGISAPLPGISRRRVDTMPAAALVLLRIIQLGGVDGLVFSAFGLREGCLYDRLSEEDKLRDPLLSGFGDIVRPFSRFALAEGVLERWITGFLPGFPAVSPRLVHALCLLADTGWAEHPSYRGEHAFLRVLRLPLVGLDHGERAFAAVAMFARYNGHLDHPLVQEIAGLIPPDLRSRALLIGCILRFGFSYSGGVAHLLTEMEVSEAEGQVTVRYPAERAAVLGETVARRVAQLSDVLGKPVVMEPVPHRAAASPLGVTA